MVDHRTRASTTAQGRAAEREVVRYLQEQGASLVATNLRLGHLELDIVARLGALVLVVEVRSRSSRSWTSAFGSLGPTKRRRIRAAGSRLWRERYQHDPTVERMRFDAASVFFGPNGPEIEYVTAAF